MNNNNKKNSNDNKRGKQNITFILFVTMLSLITVLFLHEFQGGSANDEITYNRFLKMVDEGKVESVTVKSDKIEIKAKEK